MSIPAKGPLCPEDFVEETIPGDAAMIEDVVARYQRRMLLALLATGGLFAGVFTAILL